MRRLHIFFTVLFLSSLHAGAQKITYSEYSKKEGRDTYFEILGKFDTSVLVYKMVSRKHYITRYDQQMKIVQHQQLDFINDKTFNLDFITYPNYYYIIYQYQKNNVVFCNAVKMNAAGERLSEPVVLDTTRIGFFADNKIYSYSCSENKERILIYKRQVRNDYLTVATRLFNQDFQQLDSSRQLVKYDDRRDFYSELVVDNNGDFLFARGTGKSNREKTNTIHILLHKPGMDTFRFYNISLNEQYVNEVSIKADNLNKHFMINAFYQGRKNKMVEGLFTSIIDMNGEKAVSAVFNPFSDSLRRLINPMDKSSLSFDNLTIRNIILKRKGGFVIAAEDYFTETMYNNNWNRNYMFYNNYYSGTANDYFLNNPYYYYGYRPWNSSARDVNTRYYYNDIVIMSVDSTLKLEWNNVIHKTQYDVDSENFLSFSTMNAGGEVRFLFLDKDNQKQIISNHALQPGGQIKRYPTIRSNELGYGFMPRLAKQVGARQVIIPYVYLGYIAFARIDFND
ncbi:MAG: hypothetical protein U0T56_11900 [Ferruginibacter sp.]